MLPELRPPGVSGTLGAGSGAAFGVAGAGFGVAVDAFGVVLIGVAGGVGSAQPIAKAPKARKASQFRVPFVLRAKDSSYFAATRLPAFRCKAPAIRSHKGGDCWQFLWQNFRSPEWLRPGDLFLRPVP